METSLLGQRMKELDRSINGIMIRSSLNLLLYLVGLALLLSRSPHINCGIVWMPFSLSLAMYNGSCYFLYNSLQLLRTYSTEMERIAAELNKNQQRLVWNMMPSWQRWRAYGRFLVGQSYVGYCQRVVCCALVSPSHICRILASLCGIVSVNPRVSLYVYS